MSVRLVSCSVRGPTCSGSRCSPSQAARTASRGLHAATHHSLATGNCGCACTDTAKLAYERFHGRVCNLPRLSQQLLRQAAAHHPLPWPLPRPPLPATRQTQRCAHPFVFCHGIRIGMASPTPVLQAARGGSTKLAVLAAPRVPEKPATHLGCWSMLWALILLCLSRCAQQQEQQQNACWQQAGGHCSSLSPKPGPLQHRRVLRMEILHHRCKAREILHSHFPCYTTLVSVKCPRHH